MEHYSILEGSHVLIVLPAATVVHVIASAPSLGRSVALDLEPSCTVARLKEALQEHTDSALPAARLTVFFGKAKMDDGKALVEFDPLAQGKIEVCVVVRQPACVNGGAKINGGNKQQRMSVEVEVKWGTTTATLNVSDMDAVKELRAKLGGAAPCLLLPNDSGYFFIVYKQNVMEEDRMLCWHDVKSGDTIEIFNGRVT